MVETQDFHRVFITTSKLNIIHGLFRLFDHWIKGLSVFFGLPGRLLEQWPVTFLPLGKNALRRKQSTRSYHPTGSQANMGIWKKPLDKDPFINQSSHFMVCIISGVGRFPHFARICCLMTLYAKEHQVDGFIRWLVWHVWKKCLSISKKPKGVLSKKTPKRMLNWV